MFPSIQLERVPATVASRQLTLAEVAERAAGLFLLVLSGPVLVTSALAVSALSRRSPFVAHLRVGKNNRPFWMLKLRTMWGPQDSTPRHRGWIEYVVADPAEDAKQSCDPRVSSRFAAFCRRHSIDELPQFWHVVRGDMAVVGPRPLTRGELVRHYGALAAELVSAKPGLTGLWQVSGRSNIKYPQRVAMDLKLVRELNTKMYLSILVQTFSALLWGQGAW